MLMVWGSSLRVLRQYEREFEWGKKLKSTDERNESGLLMRDSLNLDKW